MKKPKLTFEQKIVNYSLTAGFALAAQGTIYGTIVVTEINSGAGATISGLASDYSNIDFNQDGTNDLSIRYTFNANYPQLDLINGGGITDAKYLGEQKGAATMYIRVRTQNQSIPVVPPLGWEWGTGNNPNATGGGTLDFNGNGYWHNISNSFAGVRIVLSGQTYYCWLQLSVSGGSFGCSQVTLFRYAWNDVPNQGISATLPVELTSFTAYGMLNSVQLKWVTATEKNNYGFEVERRSQESGVRSQNENWEKIGFIRGTGNSNSEKLYSFTDDTPLKADVYYRLKQLDNDGSFTYSKELLVSPGTPLRFNLGQNYPNPFNPATNINFTIPESGEVTLKVYNSIGEEVADLVNHFMEAGIYTVDFKANDLPSGVYVYRLEVKGKFTAERKMNLIK